MGLHHATLKAAVLVYAALIGTMPKEALKAAIAKDEKGFTPEEVDEIYVASVKSMSDAESQTGSTHQLDFKDGILVSSERPTWLDELLASNLAIQESNQALVDAIGRFKESAGNLVTEVVAASKASVQNSSAEVPGKQDIKLHLPDYDVDSIYVVVVPFRDSADFTKLYESGEDVSHLGEHRIKHLLSTGNVEES